MKVAVLSSGSKGNSTLITTPNVKVLIDLGTSCKYVENSLRNLGIEPNEINAVFISHIHSDHIKGLKVFIKKYNPLIIVTEKLKPLLEECIGNFNYEFYNDKKIIIKDLIVESIETSHDAGESTGFLLKHNDKSLVHITDTGYINSKYYEKLTNRNMYIFESNHDIKMLRESSRPYNTQQRILGDKGHLSNDQASKYLSKFIGKDTKKVVFAHISQEANTPEKVIETFNDIMKKSNNEFNNYIIAKQNESTELMEV